MQIYPNISQFLNVISLIYIMFLKVSNISALGVQLPPRRPNLYKWLAQNSYICDPTLLNKRSHRFLAPRESVRSRCSCGDPLVTRAACGRRNGTRDKPRCFRLPESCLHEYGVIFSNAGNRLSKHLPRHRAPKPPRKKPVKFPKTRPSVARRILTKKRPSHRMPKIVSTVPVTTALRIRKQRRPLS